MGLGDNVELGLRITADASAGKREVADFRNTVTREFKGIEQAMPGRDALGRFTSGVRGASTQATTDLGKVTTASTSLKSSLLGLVGPVVGVGASVLAVTGVVTGLATSMFRMAKDASDAGSEIFDLATKTGLSATTISALKYAAEQSGGSIEELTGGVSRFSKTVGEAARGSDEARDKLIRLGVDPKKAVTDLQGELAKAFKTIADAPPGIQQTNAAIDAFGKSGASLIPTIQSFKGDLPGLIALVGNLGIAFDQEGARRADEFGDAFDTLTFQVRGTAQMFAVEWMPTFTRVMGKTSEELERNRGHWKLWAKETGSWLEWAAGKAEFFGAKIRNAVHALNDAVMDAARAAKAAAEREPQDISGGAALQAERLRLGIGPESTYDAAGGASKAASEAKAAEAARLKDIKAASDARLDVIRTERAEAKRIYDKNIADEKATAENRIVYEEAYRKRLQELLEQERAELKLQFDNKQKLAAAERALDEEGQQLLAESEARRKSIRSAGVAADKRSLDERINALVDHFRRSDEIWATRDERTRQRVELERSVGLLKESEALEQLNVVEQAAAIRRQDVIVASLQALLIARGESAEKVREMTLRDLMTFQTATEQELELQHKLIVAEAERALAAEEASRRITAARMSEGPPLPVPGDFPVRDSENPIPQDDPFFDIPPPDFTEHISAFELLKQSGVGAFKAMGSSVAGYIQNILLGEKVSLASFARLAKGVAASLASQALVEAAMELARAFAAFARYDPVAGALHLKSAAAFAIVGGIAAGAALLIPGGKEQPVAPSAAGAVTGGGSNTYEPTEGTPVVEDRGRAAMPQYESRESTRVIETIKERFIAQPEWSTPPAVAPQIFEYHHYHHERVTLATEPNDAYVVKALVRDVSNDGDARRVFVELAAAAT